MFNKTTIAAIFLLISLLRITYVVEAKEQAFSEVDVACVATPTENAHFILPVAVNKAYISTQYADYHQGIDFASNTVEQNPPIRSAEKGIVEYAGDTRYDYSEEGSWYSGYGKAVVINHENGLYSLYAHLDSIDVKNGQIIEKGKTVGKMGATGHATGTHLHFEICSPGCKTVLAAKYNPHDYLDISRVVVRLE